MMTAPSPRSDAELVAHALRGRDDAFCELVRRHQDVIYRHLRGMGVDHDASLDLVQDAFVRAHAKLAECNDPARFGAWLFRIARNLCLDHLKNVRQQSVPLSELHGVDEIADAAVSAEQQQVVRDALDRLSPALREAFLLKHDAGYTYDEIAQLTKASPSAVKMRVHRAREALCELLSVQEAGILR